MACIEEVEIGFRRLVVTDHAVGQKQYRLQLIRALILLARVLSNYARLWSKSGKNALPTRKYKGHLF